MSTPPHQLVDPIGIAGCGETAVAIAARFAAGALPGRIILHGFAPPKVPAKSRAPRIERAANLFDLASECEVVVTAYETHTKLIEAIAGSPDRPGLFGALAPGSLIADFTPAEPHEIRRLTGLLSPRAVGLVECTIAHPLRDEQSPGIVFAGGFGEHVDRLAPLLIRLGGDVERSGPQGTARLAAAYIDLGRLLSDLAQHDWSLLGRAIGIAQRQFDMALPDPAVQQALLIHRLEFLRAAAAEQGVDVPFFDALAEALKQP